MRPPADLQFILARVVREWVTDRAPSGPLLTESDPTPPAETCRQGHADWRRGPDGYRRCGTCRNVRRRKQVQP